MTSIGPGLPSAATVLPRRAGAAAPPAAAGEPVRGAAGADDAPRVSRLGQPRPGLAHAVFTYGTSHADAGAGAASRGTRIDLYV